MYVYYIHILFTFWLVNTIRLGGPTSFVFCHKINPMAHLHKYLFLGQGLILFLFYNCANINLNLDIIIDWDRAYIVVVFCE